jgi:hypothetical protein
MRIAQTPPTFRRPAALRRLTAAIGLAANSDEAAVGF